MFVFSHDALNSGEIECCGYLLDAYDKHRNIIVEYDEPHHYKSEGILKYKDVIRMNNIINKLHPIEFLRYNEKTQTLYKII